MFNEDIYSLRVDILFHANHVPCAASSRVTSTSQVLIKLLTGIEQIKHVQKIHSTMLASIMRNGNPAQESAMELPSDIRFPLESVAEVVELEAKLKDVPTKKLVVGVHIVNTVSVGNLALHAFSCIYSIAIAVAVIAYSIPDCTVMCMLSGISFNPVIFVWLSLPGT